MQQRGTVQQVKPTLFGGQLFFLSRLRKQFVLQHGLGPRWSDLEAWAGDTAVCWLCGSEGSGRGCPTVTACPAGQRPPRLAVPALLAAPCVPPLLAAPAGPSPCQAKGACSRGCLVRQKQPPLPLAWDALFKQLCVELSLSVCLSPRLCPSRMKTYYPVGARAEPCTEKKRPLSKWSESL